ncbi:MAG: PEP-CTERM sorting domain-containing protein [Phycisphaerae bacterium]|nr:PEP-CTERM sorting domain-containing protein [Phycisphaerae bacterium]
MKKSLIWAAALAMLLVGTVGVARADLLYGFEGGVQSWGRFGNGTLDFGAAPGLGSVGDGIYYVLNLQPQWWGGAVKSPAQSTMGYDMSQYTGFSADVQLSVDGLDPAFPGPGPQVELMLRLPGYLEWAKIETLPLDGSWHTISSDFADLVPQSSATDPITQAQLQNPSLEIRVLLRDLHQGDPVPSGKVRMRVDQIAAFPEPASLALLALGALVLVRRR